MGFNSETDLINYYMENSVEVKLGVVFMGIYENSSLPTSVSYRLRPATGGEQRWFTTQTYPFYQNNAPRTTGPGERTL